MAIFLALLSDQVVAGPDEAQAKKAIEAMGGRVVCDDKQAATSIIEVNLNRTQVTDSGLKKLVGLKQLQTLQLGRTRVTDAGLKEMSALKQLQTLYLGSTKVTDAGLKELAGFKQLEKLYLAETQVTDPGVAALRKALPNCKIVR